MIQYGFCEIGCYISEDLYFLRHINLLVHRAVKARSDLGHFMQYGTDSKIIFLHVKL